MNTQRLPSFADCLADRAAAVSDDVESWFGECLLISEVQFDLSQACLKTQQIDAARAAWLCALSALQAAARLIAPDDQRQAGIATEMKACTRQLLRYADPPLESIDLTGIDRAPFGVRFVPAHHIGRPAPAVICIGDEGESLDALFSRIAPVAAGKGMSLLLVEMRDIEDTPGLEFAGTITAEMRLGDCVDYLSARPDVDARHIAVCGDGLASSFATRLAISDHRIAAAVCDGGLWDSVRTRSGVEWLAGERASGHGNSSLRTRMARGIRCPFLVVANERSVGSVAEVMALHAECMRLGLRMDVDVPRALNTPLGAIRDSLRCEAFVFDWLASELMAFPQVEASQRSVSISSGELRRS